MLCVIKLKDSMLSSSMPVISWVIDVPDNLYMAHMAMYGEFKFSMLADSEVRQLVFIGDKTKLVEQKY